MSDPRLTPDPARVVRRDPAQIAVPLTDLCRTPEGPRDRQFLYGDAVTVFSEADGWSYIQAEKDGYCGHIRSGDLGPLAAPTHRVSAPATHAYARPDIKSPDRLGLSHGSRITVSETLGTFARTSLGYIPSVHLTPVTELAADPAAIAALYLGTPYLWGGNSRWGIDCSGLVQAALLTCGIPCPGDSDLQASLGQNATGPYRRNDLLFWKGHVALVTDADTLIHANAHTMSTCYEPIVDAIDRIQASGDGPISAHRRIASLSG
ncbi:NlpC/P60 family protein [Marimonas sp. MJW-29]|uniref:NlpC/P60 family protein n=1 Tax=Sulfitobacter sediminis TaxID=3234186 RepID=A0ABV3RLU6_9RHOB